MVNTPDLRGRAGWRKTDAQAWEAGVRRRALLLSLVIGGVHGQTCCPDNAAASCGVGRYMTQLCSSHEGTQLPNSMHAGSTSRSTQAAVIVDGPSPG